MKNIFFLCTLMYMLVCSPAYGGTPDTSVPPPNNQSLQEYQSFESLFTLYQPYLENITAYEPIYFLVGTNPAKSKFQISFKYRFFNSAAPLAQTYPWIKGFNFGYTQTSFWDLAATSRPFADTSYKPELFFISSNLYQGNERNSRVFAQTGLQHESNGKSDADSRGTNIAYIKPIVIFFSEKQSQGLQIAPKFWAYYKNDNENNPDLKYYRGYVDLEVTCGRPDRLVVESHFQPAREGNSFTVNLTYPAHQLFLRNLEFYVHVQYSNVLAESLLHYQERTEAMRLGISLVR